MICTAPVAVNPLGEEEEEVILEENMEAESQIELNGAEEEVKVEEAGISPGPSCITGTTQPPDEEQAGLELDLLIITER